MTTTPQTTPRAAGEAVKAFREYLAVHPHAWKSLSGHDMDDTALELARIALDFQAPAPQCLHQIAEPLSEQDAGLLKQAASMLEALEGDERNRGNCSAAEGAGCSAHAVRRLAVQLLQAAPPAQAAVAVPAVTQMAEDHARKWAWNQVQQDVGTEGWTAGDSGNFFGFFLWGWNYRGQYELQRPAAAPAQAVAVPNTITVDFKQATELLAMFGGEPTEITLMTGDGHGGNGLYANYTDMPEEGSEFLGVHDDEAVPAAPAQEHATQLAVQGHTPERQRMTAGRASFFMERFLKEEKLLGPNEQAALHFVIDMLAAPSQAQEDARDLGWLTKEGRTHGFRVVQTIVGAVVTHSTESLRAAIDAARAAQGGAA